MRPDEKEKCPSSTFFFTLLSLAHTFRPLLTPFFFFVCFSHFRFPLHFIFSSCFYFRNCWRVYRRFFTGAWPLAFLFLFLFPRETRRRRFLQRLFLSFRHLLTIRVKTAACHHQSLSWLIFSSSPHRLRPASLARTNFTSLLAFVSYDFVAITSLLRCSCFSHLCRCSLL